MTALSSFVAGEWATDGPESQDINPARPDEVVAEVRQADAALAGSAIDAAADAFKTWSELPIPARAEILRKAADILEERAESVGRDLTREEGKTLAEGIGETRRAVAILRYYAGQGFEPDGELYPSASPKTFLYARRVPLGVVVAITPWNFPIAIPTWKMAPALLYGNTVVWKPAEIVPMTAVHLLRALVDAGLPTGVLNLVLGKGSAIGNTLVTHPQTAAITFTGSNAVGRAMQLDAVAAGKKVQLELGGKNPAVVLADADLDLAAEQVARGAFMSAGQKCTATSRVIVERSIHDELVEKLATRARSWQVGDPLSSDTVVGPLASRDQLETVTSYLDIARSEGGAFAAGGDDGRDDLSSGYFVTPTVLRDLAADSRVAREEIFGPVITVVPADSLSDAIELANDTPFGLVSSLFTTDLNAAFRFARESKTGLVKINQETAGLEFQAPFGGMKASSSGSREQGKAAREFFTEWKTVYIDAL